MKQKSENIEEQKVFTVSGAIDFFNEILTPQRIIIQGEISKRIAEYPGFSFFSLLDKNQEAILNCFIWQEQLENMGIILEEGMEVKVLGYPQIQKRKGTFSFQVEQIGLVGEGILKQAFEILKKKLQKEGIFEPSVKKPIPKFCQKIGLITSAYGKGAKPDFEKHLSDFGFQIYFYDVRVEGMFATEEISKAIQWFNENILDLEVLVLIRGGGSWESLLPFNSEQVARAIFGSKIPIICGIGHESDETIAGYAADLRASTPTHAAKILSENWILASLNIREFEKNFNSSSNKIFKGVKEKINFFEENLTIRTMREIFSDKEKINNLIENLNLYFQNYFKGFIFLEKDFKRIFIKIGNLIKNKKLEIDQVLRELFKKQNYWLKRIENLLKQQEEKITHSNPTLKLKQGYTITRDKFGKIIKNPNYLKISETIKTELYKGRILSKINKIEKTI